MVQIGRSQPSTSPPVHLKSTPSQTNRLVFFQDYKAVSPINVENIKTTLNLGGLLHAFIGTRGLKIQLVSCVAAESVGSLESRGNPSRGVDWEFDLGIWLSAWDREGREWQNMEEERWKKSYLCKERLAVKLEKVLIVKVVGETCLFLTGHFHNRLSISLWVSPDSHT